MTKIAEIVKGVKVSVINLGLSMSAEELETYDEYLREHKQARSEWYIERRDETTLLTRLGSVTYQKTLFRNKFTGKYEYLLDRVMGIEKHARMIEDAEAELLEEAVQISYRKSGMAELRAYSYNGGDLLELVRYQKENIPKVAGCEDIVVSCGQMLA